MRCLGAVLRGVGRDWEIEEITLDPPREGEVLVKMAVAGMCHSDDHFTTGDMIPTPELAATMAASGTPPPEYFPFLGGHEGSGIVEETGPGVRSVRPGDHVAMSFIPACGACRFCVSGMTYLCDNGAAMVLSDMVQNCKTLKGLIYGGMNPRASTPMLLSMYRNGNLKLEELVTRRYRLDQINEAYTDMRQGRNIRGIIDFT